MAFSDSDLSEIASLVSALTAYRFAATRRVLAFLVSEVHRIDPLRLELFLNQLHRDRAKAESPAEGRAIDEAIALLEIGFPAD